MAINMKTFRVIRLFFLNSLQENTASPLVFAMFFMSKIIRYGLFISFLIFLTSGVTSIAGYTTIQMICFYLVFNLVDTAVQMLYRGVYHFRPLLISGGFDGVLAEPFSPLVRCLLGNPDFIDIGILIILCTIFVYFVANYIHPGPVSTLLFLVFLLNTLLIATALNILVLSTGILVFSVENIIGIYRDFTSMVRFPVDIFSQPVRGFLTFVIPVGLMFTYPAKTLMGLLSWQTVLGSLLLGFLFMFLSLRFWHFALRHYSSASS